MSDNREDNHLGLPWLSVVSRRDEVGEYLNAAVRCRYAVTGGCWNNRVATPTDGSDLFDFDDLDTRRSGLDSGPKVVK
jgi:hypothetical protein